MRSVSQSELEKRKPKKPQPKKPAPDNTLAKSLAAEQKAMAEATRAVAESNEKMAKMVQESINAVAEAVSKPQKREPVRLKVKRDSEDKIEYVDVVPLRKK